MKESMECRSFLILLLVLSLSTGFFAFGCGGGDDDERPPLPQPNLAGTAVLDLKLLISNNGAPPADAFPGYTPISMDLNEGTGGDYVWLYYKLGMADGSEGVPISEIYTVDETDGENVKSENDTQLSINLNSNSALNGDKIYLAFRNSDWPVVRGIAVANYDNYDDTTVIKYAPPSVENEYPVVWVQEQLKGDLSSSPPGPWGAAPQDLNEGTSWLATFPLIYVTDYIYIGYCVDQEVYDWLQQQ